MASVSTGPSLTLWRLPLDADASQQRGCTAQPTRERSRSGRPIPWRPLADTGDLRQPLEQLGGRAGPKLDVGEQRLNGGCHQVVLEGLRHQLAAVVHVGLKERAFPPAQCV